MKICVSCKVDKGPVRLKNDDRILILDGIYDEGCFLRDCETPFIAAVCDGVGGYNGGDIAAAFVCEKLSELKITADFTKEVLDSYFSTINTELVSMKNNPKQSNEFLTTVSGIILTDNKVWIFNSGDSRVYRVRNGLLRKMTEDHSVVQERINQGAIYEDEELELSKCSQITRYLGGDNINMPDVTEINTRALINDKYLICSDGLWSVVNLKIISDVLTSDLSLKDMCELLFKKAIDNNTDDNISVCVIQVKE